MVELFIACVLTTLFYMALYITVHVKVNTHPDPDLPVCGLPHTSHHLPAHPGENDYTGHVCCYCRCLLKKKWQTKEHLIPLSRGGNNTDFNVRYCCGNCNTYRANKPLSVWYNEVVALRRTKRGRRAEFARLGRIMVGISKLRKYLKANMDKVFVSEWDQQQNKSI